VDIGQTVAASFQTPTLIKIAQDLSKMQIDSSFAEADIGNIKVGQKAKFSVDAFPNRNFEGVVKQLRLNPTVTSNVVTYNVVVSVDNPDKTLLPGMTAYVNIMVARHDNVLLAPNAALRFKPRLDENQTDSSTNTRGQGQGRKKSSGGDIARGKVYVLKNGKITPIRVNVGISDGKFTEISSNELKVNDQVVIGENQANGDNTPPTNSTMRFRMF
jgi:HlyD family secretion protein